MDLCFRQYSTPQALLSGALPTYSVAIGYVTEGARLIVFISAHLSSEITYIILSHVGGVFCTVCKKFEYYDSASNIASRHVHKHQVHHLGQKIVLS